MAEPSELTDRLRAVREEIARVEAELERLRDEHEDLRLRLEGAEQVPTDSIPPNRVRITPSIRDILRQSESPLTRSDIVYSLQSRGIQASEDAVSASLSYLKRQGWAKNVSRLWMRVERFDSDET